MERFVVVLAIVKAAAGLAFQRAGWDSSSEPALAALGRCTETDCLHADDKVLAKVSGNKPDNGLNPTAAGPIIGSPAQNGPLPGLPGPVNSHGLPGHDLHKGKLGLPTKGLPKAGALF